MKKLYIIVGLLAVAVGILVPLVVKAVAYESDDWYAGSSVSYSLPLLYEDGSIRKDVEIIKIVHKSDGEPAFCVEPYKGAQLSDSYVTTKQDTIFDSLEQRIEVAKIVMAYKAVDTDYASDWDVSPAYAAAQYLIWDTLGYKFDIDDVGSDYDKFASEIPKILEAKAIFEQKTMNPDLVIEDEFYSVGDEVYVTDKNGILNEDDYVVYGSEGIDELSIAEGGVSFVITSDEPETKTIEVEHIGEIPARWEYGELWSDGRGQKFFSFFSVDLPVLYGDARVSLYLDSLGALTIVKVDESGKMIEDGEFTFALYEAIYDGTEYVIGDVISGFEQIVVNGSETISVAPGHYFIKEISADEAYILDEQAYLIEAIAGTEVEFTLANPHKYLTVELNKYDEEDDSPISGAHFAVYDLEEGEDTIYLLKTGEMTDLIDLLGRDDIYIADEDIDFDGQWFMSEENTHITAYAITEGPNDVYTLEGFEPLVYRSSSYKDPLEDVKVYKDETDITENLECIYDGSERVVYKLTDLNEQYLIIRPKKTYDIGRRPEVFGEAVIYMISDTFDIYTGISDIYDGSGYSVKEVVSGSTSDTGKVSFTGLDMTQDYLVCEVIIPDGYEYGDQDPCIAITEDKTEVTNITFTDKVRMVDIEMIKTDTSRNILLDGAEFIAYRAKKTDGPDFIFEGAVPEDAIYMGHFVSGHLHVTLADFGLTDEVTGYTLAIYRDGELKKEVTMQKEVNVDGLIAGTYDLYLRDGDGGILSTSVQKEVAKGRIIFEDIRYDEVVILYEVKAPSGYKTDTEGFVISADGPIINGHIAYNRVNEAVLLPPSKTKRPIVATYSRYGS